MILATLPFSRPCKTTLIGRFTRISAIAITFISWEDIKVLLIIIWQHNNSPFRCTKLYCCSIYPLLGAFISYVPGVIFFPLLLRFFQQFKRQAKLHFTYNLKPIGFTYWYECSLVHDNIPAFQIPCFCEISFCSSSWDRQIPLVVRGDRVRSQADHPMLPNLRTIVRFRLNSACCVHLYALQNEHDAEINITRIKNSAKCQVAIKICMLNAPDCTGNNKLTMTQILSRENFPIQQSQFL